MKDGKLLEEMANWLEKYPWMWFCTLTSRPGMSEAQLRWCLLRWTEQLEAKLGNEVFEWVGVPEHGVTGLNPHFHVLIAGLKNGCGAAERLDWMRRWYKLAGDAQIEDFKADAGGVRYILKHVRPESVDTIEFHLVSVMAASAGAK